MFFQSSKSLFVGIILIPVASYQLFWGLVYADAAKREASTVGTITSVTCGRGCTYNYVFVARGIKSLDYSSICKTPLSARGCEEGGAVQVYYDPRDTSTSALEDLGAAGREKLLFGSLMALSGLLLIGLYFIPYRRRTSEEESQGPDRSECDDKPDVLHIVPDE
jgi:hypothetical protein